MIRKELDNNGYECWEPILGGPGVIQHARKPEVFITPIVNNSSTNPTSAQGRQSTSSGSSGNVTTRSETPQINLNVSSTHRYSTSSNRTKK